MPKSKPSQDQPVTKPTDDASEASPNPFASGRIVPTDAELPDWFKLLSGVVILASLLAVTTQAVADLSGYLVPEPIQILEHPIWMAISILLVPVLTIYRMFRRRQRTWKIDVRSSGWANFFLWWGILYYVLLGGVLLSAALR